MAFVDGTGRNPPHWWTVRQLGRAWSIPPWDVEDAPIIWAVREIFISNEEMKEAKRKASRR
jgi:hypothetical protein